VLLRRIRNHITNENWFAVFVDFVIVVVGVYVGIEVSNWNEARKEESKAHGYLERIRDDLAADQTQMENRLMFWNSVADHGVAAIAFAERGSLVEGNEWKTIVAFYQASQVAPYFSIDTTYLALRSSGELGLIRRQELQRALADYYINGVGSQADYLLRYKPAYRETIRGLTPWDVQMHIWSSCYSSEGLEQQLLLDCASPVSPAEVKQILEVFVGHPTVVPELRFWMSNQSVATTILEDNRVRLARLLELIDGALATN